MSTLSFLALTIGDLLPAGDATAPGRSSTVGAFDPSRLQASVPSRHVYRDGTTAEIELTTNDVVLDGRNSRIVLSQDLTERKRAAAEVAAARDEAVDTSRMKSAFLANISHEIRTPMNEVVGLAALLLEGELAADERSLAEHLARGQRQGAGLIQTHWWPSAGDAIAALLGARLD